MAGIGYFGIPADDVDRAKTFYASLLGWKIEPDTVLENRSLQWQNIITGEPEKGLLNTGGLFRRYVAGPIMDFVVVDDFEGVYDRVEKLGGRIVMPKNTITHVGTVAMIRDTEGNILGLLKPEHP
jgi:predicted enzyme related to lactoylglutathione lyase